MSSSNPYKRMYVLSEDEYNRLKLQQKSLHPPPPPSPLSTSNIDTSVEEPKTDNDSIHVSDAIPKTNNNIVSSSSNNYTCTICGKSYKQKRDLRRHIKLSHAPPTTAVIPKAPLIQANTIAKTTTKKTKKKKVVEKFKVFDKVKKWMTMRG